MGKTLILANGFTGHPLEITPLLRAATKNDTIHLVIDESQQRFLDNSPYAEHQFLLSDDNTDSLATFIEKQHYEKIISLHHSKFAEKVKQLYPSLQKKKSVFQKLTALFTKEKTGDEDLSKLFSKNGWQNDGFGLDFKIEDKDRIKENDLPHSHAAGFYVVVLDNDSMQGIDFPQLVSSIDHPLVLIGEGNAAHNGNRIAELDPVKIYNACGKFSFKEMGDIISRSKLVVSTINDFFYVAVANNKKVIVLQKSNISNQKLSGLYSSAALEANKNILQKDSEVLQNKGQLGMIDKIKSNL